MATKQELVDGVNKIPNFVLRKVYYEEELPKETPKEVEGNIVTEEGDDVPLAFVSPRYELVQFRNVFMPLIEDIDELNGSLIYYRGCAIMDVFPEDEEFKEDDDRFGLSAINSVDKTSAIILRFCVRHNNRILVFPKSIAGFKRVHVGNISGVTKNYISVLNNVRRVWKNIITQFSKIDATEEETTIVLDKLEIKDKSLRKYIMKHVMSRVMNIWDVFVEIIEYVSDKKYKTSLHRRKKLEKICNTIFTYAVVARLQGV